MELKGRFESRRGEDLYRMYKKDVVDGLYSGKNVTFIGVSTLGYSFLQLASNLAHTSLAINLPCSKGYAKVYFR